MTSTSCSRLISLGIVNVFVGLVIKIKLGIGMSGLWDIYIKEGSLNYLGIGVC